MICARCGHQLRVGDYPFCRGTADGHRGGTFNAVPDEVPGGFWIENAWREPRKFYSQSAYEKALDADGLMLAPKWRPGSKHLSNWATMDPYTLENARILVSRQAESRASKDPETRLESFRLETRALDETLAVRAES